MSTKQAHYLIIKFLSDELSKEEMIELEQLLEDPANKDLFSEVIEANFASDFSLKEFSSESLHEVLKEKIQQEESPFYLRRIRPWIKYAAILVMFLGIAYFFRDTIFRNEQQIFPKDDAIVLELENGKTEILNLSGTKLVQNEKGIVIGKQSNNVIQYSDDAQIEKLVYNTLKVPFGKQFDLILSDGTKVFLNAGTSLKYPVKFLPGLKREVFLTGEAYFDVTEDKAHPFIVNANELDVAVLGTQFVVSLYEEDRETSVVLVDGLVNLSQGNADKDVRLTPGTRGVLDKGSDSIRKSSVNTGVYTAWMQGVLVFRNETFENIAKKLERIYNVSIISENPDFNQEIFNASFDNETIEDILSYFHDSYDMEYTIENNIIYIKRKRMTEN